MVEKFFSKEIKYLVSNKREAKYVECLRLEMATPNPDSGQSSPFPYQTAHQPAGSHKDCLKSGSQGQGDSMVTSRGKSLVERVVKEQERIQMDKTLSNALEWGVKILYIDDVITYVEKRKKQVVPKQTVGSASVKKRTKLESKPRAGFPKSQAARITTPFIKVEDTSRHYRPIYAALSKMPEINMATAPPCTPFCMDEKDQKKNGHSEERRHGRAKVNRDKKQTGFCECCLLQYDNLRKHEQSKGHLAFTKGSEYLVLDRIISTMQCHFAVLEHKTKRPKCSMLLSATAPRPYGTELLKPQCAFVSENRRKPSSISTGAFGREPANGLLATEPIPGSVQTSGAKSNLRNLDQTCTQPLPTHTSHTCRTDSVCDQTADACELVQTPPTLQGELAPSRGNSLVLDSFRLCRFSQTGIRAMPQYPKEDSQSGCPSRIPCSESIQDFMSQGRQNEPVTCQEKKTLVPEFHAINPLEQSGPSPVRTIKRQVKVHKRKRLKVDLGSPGHKNQAAPGGATDDDWLCLFQLFPSSDHMDVEFEVLSDA